MTGLPALFSKDKWALGRYKATGAHCVDHGCPTYKGPHSLLWAGSQAARGRITISSTSNCISYCEIFIVHTQFTNVSGVGIYNLASRWLEIHGLDVCHILPSFKRSNYSYFILFFPNYYLFSTLHKSMWYFNRTPCSGSCIWICDNQVLENVKNYEQQSGRCGSWMPEIQSAMTINNALRL
jgi:hypothetical protein